LETLGLLGVGSAVNCCINCGDDWIICFSSITGWSGTDDVIVESTEDNWFLIAKGTVDLALVVRGSRKMAGLIRFRSLRWCCSCCKWRGDNDSSEPKSSTISMSISRSKQIPVLHLDSFFIAVTDRVG
jgi:hypothetical protein